MHELLEARGLPEWFHTELALDTSRFLKKPESDRVRKRIKFDPPSYSLGAKQLRLIALMREMPVVLERDVDRLAVSNTYKDYLTGGLLEIHRWLDAVAVCILVDGDVPSLDLARQASWLERLDLASSEMKEAGAAADTHDPGFRILRTHLSDLRKSVLDVDLPDDVREFILRCVGNIEDALVDARFVGLDPVREALDQFAGELLSRQKELNEAEAKHPGVKRRVVAVVTAAAFVLGLANDGWEWSERAIEWLSPPPAAGRAIEPPARPGGNDETGRITSAHRPLRGPGSGRAGE